MKITNRTLIRTTSIIDVTISDADADYKFQVVLHEAPGKDSFISNIEYLERWSNPIKSSLKREMRKLIRQSFGDEQT